MKNILSLTFTTTIIGTIITVAYLYFFAQTGPPLTDTTPTVETQVKPAPVAPIVDVADADRQLALGEIQVCGSRRSTLPSKVTETYAGVELDSHRNRHGNMTYVMKFTEAFEVDGKFYTQIHFTNNIATVFNPGERGALQGKFSISGKNLKINITGSDLQIRFNSNRVWETRETILNEQHKQRMELKRIEEDARRLRLG